MSPATPNPAPRARILCNIDVAFPVEGFAVRSFGDYLPAEADRSAWRAERERRPLAEILALIPDAERPDILVCASPEYLPIPWDIRAFPGPKALLITDWNVCLRFLPGLCSLFDFCFTDWPGYRLLRKAGIQNVHHQALFGHDPGRFSPGGSLRNLDVSFCGNLNAGLHGHRNRLLARVARWAHRSGRPVHLRQAFEADYVDVLRRSRMVFNHSIRGEANMRLFEAMACGAVPLVEAGNLEASILFQEGRHFLRYEPDRLEERLDEWAAQPDRLAGIAAEASREVARHTRPRQWEAFLDAVLRESRTAPPTVASQPAPPLPFPLEGRKDLAKIRVLGMGYTAQAAIGEIQARSPDCPGLDREALPALLFAIMERERGPVVHAARQALDHLLSAGMPEFLRRYLRLQAARQAGEWSQVADLAAACRRALEAAAPEEVLPGGPLYATLLPPLDLGKGMNTDLNQAFLADLTERAGRKDGRDATSGGGPAGSPGAGRRLLLRHCAFAEAEALLRMGKPSAALSAASGLASSPHAASIPLHWLRLSAAVEAGDTGAVRQAGLAWFGDSPLDTGMWDILADAFGRAGDRDSRISLLEDTLVLSRALLAPEKTGLIASRLQGARMGGA